MDFKNIFSMESAPAEVEDQNLVIVEGEETSIAPEMIGIDEAGNTLSNELGDIEKTITNISEAQDDLDDLSSMEESINESVANNEAIDPIAAESIRIRLSKIQKKYGFDTSYAQVIFAKENFQVEASRSNNTIASLESIGEAISSIGSGIVNALSSVWNKIAELSDMAVNFFTVTQKGIERSLAKAQKLQGKPTVDVIKSPANVRDTFVIEGTITPESIITVGRAHEQASNAIIKNVKTIISIVRTMLKDIDKLENPEEHFKKHVSGGLFKLAGEYGSDKAPLAKGKYYVVDPKKIDKHHGVELYANFHSSKTTPMNATDRMMRPGTSKDLVTILGMMKTLNNTSSECFDLVNAFEKEVNEMIKGKNNARKGFAAYMDLAVNALVMSIHIYQLNRDFIKGAMSYVSASMGTFESGVSVSEEEQAIVKA